MAADDKLKSQEDAEETAFGEFCEAWSDRKDVNPEEFCSRYPECSRKLRTRIEKFLFVAKGLRAAGDSTIHAPSSVEKDEAIPSGKVLGDFRIIREIGSGGMGTVYEAEQVSLRRKVALKVLSSHLSLSDRAVLKFRREAEAGGRQSHPGIVSVYSVGEEKGAHYIAQELVEGENTLADRLAELNKNPDQPPGYFRATADFLVSVARALQHAHHSGVIHRDVKPSNILVTLEGKPKVTDFGLAKVEDALALSRSGDFAGTPFYMSPEQVARGAAIDRRTDIYSLGVTFYEMLTLTRPFEGDSTTDVLKMITLQEPKDPRRVNPRVPRDLAVICLKAMEKKPEERYSAMEALAADLERFLSGDVILAQPASIPKKIWRRIRRRPALSTAISVAIFAVLALLFYMPWSYVQMARKEREAVKAKELAESRYQEIRRLSDGKRLSQLEAQAETLWPARPGKVPLLEKWLREAAALAGRLPLHRKTLTELRRKGRLANNDAEGKPAKAAWLFSETEEQWQHDALAELVAGLGLISDEGRGSIKSMEARTHFARTVHARTIETHRLPWKQALSSIANVRDCPAYQGLVIKPQIGLLPLGRDPDSGLWEFAHLQTGKVPERGQDGKLVLNEECGLVFVLIPGGSFQMGAERPSEDRPEGSPNVDRYALSREKPVHPVRLEPYLLSKYEMTQAQWLRFTGENPSVYRPPRKFGDKTHSLLHPIENVSWEDCDRVLAQLGLRLPSEAEWEYAARAGTTTPWWTGSSKKSLSSAANLLDLFYRNFSGTAISTCEEWLDDGYVTHSPVGRYRANPFGLHDICGNLCEWCQDTWQSDYSGAPAGGQAWIEPGSANRIIRDGCWDTLSPFCRSALREWDVQGARGCGLGVRPAADLRKEKE